MAITIECNDFPVVESSYLMLPILTKLIGFDNRRVMLRYLVTALAVSIVLAVPLTTFGQSEDDQSEAIELFNMAQDAHEKTELAKAIDLYGQALAKFPTFPEAAFQRGVAQRQLGRFADAERSFRSAIEMNPDWSLALTSLATLLLDRDQTADVEQLLDRAIRIDPDNPPALAAMADLKLRNNADPRSLQQLLDKIVVIAAKANPTVQILLAKAAVEDRLGKRKDSMATLEKILLIDPDNFAAIAALIELLAADRDVLRSRTLIERIEAKHPDRDKDRIAYLRAVIFAADGKLAEARLEIEKMAVQTAASSDLRDRIIAADSNDAAQLESTLSSDPNNALVLGRLCSIYRRQDPARAMEMCRRAAEIDPGNSEYAIGYAAALVQAKQFASAVVILDRVLAREPDNSTARANLATALFQLKRYDEAKKHFLWLNEKQPTSAAPVYFLAIIHDQLGDYLDALASYQEYLRLADAVSNADEIERVNLRLPIVQKLVKEKKYRKKK